MSNMYTILESLKRVMPSQQPQETKPAQPVYESVEAKGSIVAGVKDVEQRLREQFEAIKEGEKIATKTGTIHKGTYGTEYQGDPDDEDAPKRGRPAKGTVKKEKVAKVKGPKGRPKKDPAPVYSKSNDPFGRVPDKAPKGKKGTVIKGKATQDTNESQLDELSPKTLGSYIKHASTDAKFKGHQAGNQQGWAMAQSDELFGGIEAGSDTDEKAHSRLRGVRKATDKLVGKTTQEGMSNPFANFKKQAKDVGALRSKTMESSRRMAKLLVEGVNFTEMIKKKDMTLQEMLAELQADIQTFKETGHCSELLRDCMEVHSFNKQQLNDAIGGSGPAGAYMRNKTAPWRPGTPEPKPGIMDKAKDFGGKVLNTLGHGSDEDLKADLRRNMGMQEAAELNELARLAGLTVKESNDGNLANNYPPYKDVTQGDVVAGRLGKDEQGGKQEVDEAPTMGGKPVPEMPKSLIGGPRYSGSTEPIAPGPKSLIGGPRFSGGGGYTGKGIPAQEANELDEVAPKALQKAGDAVGQVVGGALAGALAAIPGIAIGGAALGPGGAIGAGAALGLAGAKAGVDIGGHLGRNATNKAHDSVVNLWRKASAKLGGPEATTEFVKAHAQGADLGKDSFEFGGKEYAVTMDRAQARQAMKELSNVAQTVGEGDMEEGNEFSGELAKAKAQHKDSFEVDGKTYPVQEGETCPTCHSEPCCCDDTEEADRELAKLKENCGITSPIGSMAQDMQQQQGRMSINTSQSTDGTKNVNISADGEAADQLMQILKMAGMASGQHEHQHAEVVIAAQPMEAKEYGDTDIEKPEEVLNTPRPDVRGMHRAETVGYADTTDDLNKQKDQDPETANKAANPKAAKVNKVEESSPLDALGAKLMAEYQAIKITK